MQAIPTIKLGATPLKITEAFAVIYFDDAKGKWKRLLRDYPHAQALEEKQDLECMGYKARIEHPESLRHGLPDGKEYTQAQH